MTIIVANWNNRIYLDDCFSSLANQTCKHFSVLFIDDCSDDGSFYYVLQEITSKFPSIKITVKQNGINIGYTRTLIRGIDLAGTDIVGILDSDDALEPTAIEEIISYYAKYRDVGFVYTNFWYCNENLERMKSGFCQYIPPHKSNILFNGVSHFKTFRKKLYKKTVGLDQNMLYGQDKDLSYKMEEVCQLKFIPKPLYLLRRGGKNSVHIDPKKYEMSKRYAEEAKSKAMKRRREYPKSIDPSMRRRMIELGYVA